MRMTATVAGKAHDVPEAGLAALVAFERHFGLPSSVLSPDDPTPGRAEWVAFMTWQALRKAGVFALDVSFDDALDAIEDFEQVLEPGDKGYKVPGAEESDEAPDPTQAPSDSELPAS